MLESVTTAAATTVRDTEVLVRTAACGGTEGLTALKSHVDRTVLEGAVEETDTTTASDILVTALVDALSNVDDGRSATWDDDD